MAGDLMASHERGGLFYGNEITNAHETLCVARGFEIVPVGDDCDLRLN